MGVFKSQQKLAHAATAHLLCHVQNFIACQSQSPGALDGSLGKNGKQFFRDSVIFESQLMVIHKHFRGKWTNGYIGRLSICYDIGNYSLDMRFDSFGHQNSFGNIVIQDINMALVEGITLNDINN